jgi:hypothetical protein
MLALSRNPEAVRVSARERDCVRFCPTASSALVLSRKTKVQVEALTDGLIQRHVTTTGKRRRPRALGTWMNGRAHGGRSAY